MSSQLIVEEWRDIWNGKSDAMFVILAFGFCSADLNYIDAIEKHSGASFVIAYAASLFLCCLPLLIMELSLGQLVGKSPIQAIGNMCPLFKGVGVGIIILCFAVVSWNSVLLGHIGYYFVQVFLNAGHNLPWTSCTDESWKPENCPLNGSSPATHVNKSMVLTAVDYYRYDILDQSETISETGDLVWQSLAAAGAVWLLAFAIVFLGIHWLSKVCCFSVCVSVVLLFVMLVRATTLPGTNPFINSLFTVRWESLVQLQLWKDVFTMSLTSMGIGYGVYITAGSYNVRSANMVGQAFTLLFAHLLVTTTRVFVDAGFRGHALENGIAEPVKDFSIFQHTPSLGLGLSVVSHFGVSHLWSVLYLLMSFLFLVNKITLLCWSCTTAFEDATLDHKASRCCPRVCLALIVCGFGFLSTFGYCLQAGIYAISLISHFFNLLPIWVLLFFEILSVAYFYCAHLLAVDTKDMVEDRCSGVFGLVLLELLYFIPAVPIFILFVNLSDVTDFLPPAMERADWVEPLGWVLASLPLIPIPVYMIYVSIKSCVRGTEFTYWQRFKYSLASPLRYEVVKSTSPSPPQRYNSLSSARYTMLNEQFPPVAPSPSAPLAEPEHYGGAEQINGNSKQPRRVMKVSRC